MSNNHLPATVQESSMAGVRELLAQLAVGRSPLLSVTEKPFLERVNVKGDVASTAFQAAILAHTGAALPQTPNTVSESDDYSIFWLAPGEWLIQSRSPRHATLEKALQQALIGQFAAAVDTGSGSTSLMLAGSKAAAVLQKGCPLDLHARVFVVGQCAQSHYFHSGILLRPLPQGSYEVVIRRSFSDYFGRILHDAAQEYVG